MDQAREFQPDLLLCDISMPGKDGLFLVNEINRELPDCRILVLTGFYSNHKAVRETATRLSRRVGILTKPCPARGPPPRGLRRPRPRLIRLPPLPAAATVPE